MRHDDSAQLLAEEINQLNIQRQRTETEIFAQADAAIESNPAVRDGKIIVVDGEGWHQGVVGIVAARITERYGRPSVVISRDGENAKGSCRSIEGFSIYDAIESVSDCLEHFGGHTLAAGVGLRSENIDEFRRRINEYAADKEMPFAVQRIDCRIQPASISLDMLSSLSLLEPFGAATRSRASGFSASG